MACKSPFGVRVRRGTDLADAKTGGAGRARVRVLVGHRSIIIVVTGGGCLVCALAAAIGLFETPCPLVDLHLFGLGGLLLVLLQTTISILQTR